MPRLADDAAPLRARPLLFLDFEASALTPGSWPVEIGWARIEDGRVSVRAEIIAPRPDWSMADWSEVSARVHGIPLAAIRAGRPADDIAAETDAFAGCEIVSDNPAWDQRWLDRLRAGRPRLAVRPFAAALRERLDDAQANALARTLLRAPAPHRAGPDAERLARAWLAASRAFGLAA